MIYQTRATDGFGKVPGQWWGGGHGRGGGREESCPWGKVNGCAGCTGAGGQCDFCRNKGCCNADCSDDKGAGHEKFKGLGNGGTDRSNIIFSRYYPRYYGFGGPCPGSNCVLPSQCPDQTQYEKGRGCCLPANLTTKGAKICCPVQNTDVVAHKQGDGTTKYSLICKSQVIFPLDGNGNGGTRIRTNGWPGSTTSASTTDTGSSMSTWLLLGGLGVGAYLLFGKKKKAATPAAGGAK